MVLEFDWTQLDCSVLESFVCFHSNLKEGQCPKRSNYHKIAPVSHASRVMLKILQASLQQHVK